MLAFFFAKKRAKLQKYFDMCKFFSNFVPNLCEMRIKQ